MLCKHLAVEAERAGDGPVFLIDKDPRGLEVEKQFQRMQNEPSHPYLENERGLSPALLGSARFAGQMRTDAMGNAVFPHYDQDGLCGYAIKNKGFHRIRQGRREGAVVLKNGRR